MNMNTNMVGYNIATNNDIVRKFNTYQRTFCWFPRPMPQEELDIQYNELIYYGGLSVAEKIAMEQDYVRIQQYNNTHQLTK